MTTKNSDQKSDKAEDSKDNIFIRYDEYWLKKARLSIGGTIEAMSKRLTSLNTFLNYLALGTFMGIVGVTYTTYLSSSQWPIFLMFILPLILIAYAKFVTSVEAGELILRKTDMRSPTQINDGFFKIIEAQSKKIKSASTQVGVATFFTLICFPIAIFLQNLENAKDMPEKYFSVTMDSNNLYFKGSLGEVTKVSGVLYGKDSKNKAKNPTYVDFLLQKSGELNATVNLNNLGIKLDSVELIYLSKKQQSRHTLGFSGSQFKSIQTNQTKKATHVAKDSI